ncbi:UDP-N-acetylglucosamine 2-epimerase (hydrolyzing) [Alcaligenaceae bacterium SJ-26]|nr:UDP-N-acetylglucosamine 2-epimerase (hydrolyzing) [Alcaligenaceae bacterium SJ-26]
MSRRHICYLTGTRADFGLMASTLQRIEQHPALDLSLIVTGMHLSEQFGFTAREVEAAGFDIQSRIPCDMRHVDGAQMAVNIAVVLQGCVQSLMVRRPDLLLVLGDRGEMLAATLAAVHLGIPVAHVHGGERSGTIDESVRHAISKLAHIHLVSTVQARERLIQMGELSEYIHVVGAPGLDGLTALELPDRSSLCCSAGLDPEGRVALLVFHPVLQEAASAGEQMRVVAQALRNSGYQVLALMPNADAGNEAVREVLESARAADFVLKTHLPRADFLAWMACVDVMIGNSSSGIIEAASFGTPVVNVGSRQNMRERNANVHDVPIDSHSLGLALRQVSIRDKGPYQNIYGDGRAADRIAELLAHVPLSPSMLDKCNAY